MNRSFSLILYILLTLVLISCKSMENKGLKLTLYKCDAIGVSKFFCNNNYDKDSYIVRQIREEAVKLKKKIELKKLEEKKKALEKQQSKLCEYIETRAKMVDRREQTGLKVFKVGKYYKPEILDQMKEKKRVYSFNKTCRADQFLLTKKIEVLRGNNFYLPYISTTRKDRYIL